MSSTWPAWQKLVDWLLGKINTGTGLVSLASYAFIGPADGGSAISCAAVQALQGAADVAMAVGDAASAKRCAEAAHRLADAVNLVCGTKIWEPMAIRWLTKATSL